MSRTLVIAGITLIVIGLAFPWLQRLGLGRLPGDILIERGNFRLYLPVTTSLLVSAILSLLLWLIRR